MSRKTAQLGDTNLMMLAALAALIVGAFAIFLYRNRVSPQPDIKTMTVALAAENNSGESGTAVLKEVNGKTLVTITMTGAPKGVAQPAHIHVGACPGVGAIKYPLTSIINGQSNTTLNVKISELIAQEPLALNVHKSTTLSKVYVSCGALK